VGARTVWILTHSRLGDRQQMEKLAAALGWPSTVKRLVFRPPNVPFLAPLLLDRGASDSLDAPWPDLVLCGEARTSVIARDLKRRSGGRIKIVCLGRPAGDPAQFDLVLTTAQYRLPKAANVVELALPLVVEAPALPSDAGGGMPDIARPVTTVLIGGTAVPERLDSNAASSLARDLLAHQQKTGGTLLIVTSPRTGAAAGEVLARAIPSPHIVHLWRKSEDNPYRRFLALADEVVVTSDSVSMVADALAAGKPVSVYRLPRKATVKDAVVEGLFARVYGEDPCPFWLKPAKWLFDSGLIEVRADRPRLFDRLVRGSRLGWFGEARAEKRFAAPDEFDVILPRITALF
jgi:mitochondrial fission protein ELM1